MLQAINAMLVAKGSILKEGTVIDATLIGAPSSTKNRIGTRDAEMRQTKKEAQWHFFMKGHIGVDADSGLVHTVIGTVANTSDITQAHELMHGEERDVFRDAGYQGVEKRGDTQAIKTHWHVAMRPGKRKALPETPLGRVLDEIARTKARIRAKAEHPFRMNKRQFGHVEARYRGLAKNTAQLLTPSALANLWMARHRIQ